MSDFIPNSFQIPNVLIDDLLPYLTPREFSCLVIIIRKTQGWHKQSDYISITQFAKITNTKDKRTLYHAIDTLESCGLIRIRKVIGKINYYTLGEVFERPPEGEPVTKNRTGQLVAKIVTSLGTKNATGLGLTSSKKCTSTKDMNTKDSENSAPLRSKRSAPGRELKSTDKITRSALSRDLQSIDKSKSAQQRWIELGSKLGVKRERREKFQDFTIRVQTEYSRSQFSVGV